MQPENHKIKAIILAAGYATRLYPLTLNITKPLLKITKDKAVIDFIADDLGASGFIEEIIVVTNRKFYADFLGWAKNRDGRLKISVVDDGTFSNDDRLGAVGDMYFAVKKRKIFGDFVVIGGDNLFDGGFSKFLEFALKHSNFASLGLFNIKNKKEAVRFGVVTVDKQDKVSSFEEKPAQPKSTKVATCLYYFPSRTLELLEKYVEDKALSKDAPGSYIRWLMQEDTVFGFTLEKGHWDDIGHLDCYKEVVVRYDKH